MLTYKFENFEKGLLAFIGNLELKLHQVLPDMPVYMINSGDNSYYFKQKFETGNNQKTVEIYQKVPRVILAHSDVEIQTDENTNQYVTTFYNYLNKNYSAKTRRQSFNFPINFEFVTSNYLTALSYLELTASLFSIDNTFTYESMGLTYMGSYQSKAFSLVKPEDGADSSTRNYNIRCTIDVNFQPMLIRISTIKDTIILDDNGNEIKPKTIISLNANEPLYIDQINPNNPDNPLLTKNTFIDPQ